MKQKKITHRAWPYIHLADCPKNEFCVYSIDKKFFGEVMILVKCLSAFMIVSFFVGCQSGTKLVQKEASDIALDVKEKVYKNGLKVLVIENPKFPIFSYYTYYLVGGKYEKPGITGASHYLEHMMFKGAKKYGLNIFDDIIEGNGGNNNAYTSNDLTVYYENLPSHALNLIIDVEADRMQNLLLEKNAFEQERKVILEERRMRYENSDRGKIYLGMMQNMFEKTPYGTSVIGSIKDLKTVSRDQIFEYFKNYYAPNNAVIVIAGDVDADDVFDEIDQKFGKIPPSENLQEIKDKAFVESDFEFQGKYNRWVKLNGSSPNPKFMLAYQGVKIGTNDGFVLDILSSILGTGESSYLSKEFVLNHKPKLAGVYAANYTLQESGVFFIGGELLGATNLSTFKRDLYRTVKKSCDLSITKRAVQKVKNQYLLGMVSGLDTNAGLARFIGDREVHYKDYNFYKKEMDIYDAISVDELKKKCVEYLKPERSIFLSIWNKHAK